MASGTPQEVAEDEMFELYLATAEAYYGVEVAGWRIHGPNTSKSSPHVVFISYRRSDSPYAVGAIRDGLVAQFGADAVFLDVDSIPLGHSFPQALDQALRQCAAVLVIIGDQWLDTRRGDGGRRLDDPI